MAVSSGALAPRLPRRLSEWIALAVLGALLLCQLGYLGLGLASQNLVIAVGTYQIERKVVDRLLVEKPEGWFVENAEKEAHAVFQDITPKFREHRPFVDVTSTRFVVTVLVKNGANLPPMFESLGQRLDGLIREQQLLPPEAPLVALTDVLVTPYPWFKSLDLVSLVVLLGAGGAWVFLP
jgi:hypothetical protein